MQRSIGGCERTESTVRKRRHEDSATISDRARPSSLEQRVQAFTRQLGDFLQIDLLDHGGQFRFFRRLLNYDDWRIAGAPKRTQFLDYQTANSDIEAERDLLRVGDHFVRVLTMKE